MTQESKQTATLANTHIVEVDGKAAHVPVPVTVRFRMFPIPIVLIEADTLPPQVLSKERFEVVLANGVRLEEVMVSSINLGTLKGALVPAQQPVTAIDKGVPLREIRFCVLNFSIIYGSRDKCIEDEAVRKRIPHSRIEASGWCVEITGVPNVQDVEKGLERERGIGITYDGRITRLDATGFTVKEVEAFLDALRIFLSFARGAWCSFAAVEGKDQDGRRSWVRWGARCVTPRANHHLSWFRPHGGDDILSAVFPRFWNLFENGEGWRETLKRAIDWYVTSNTSVRHVGVILTKAALERLSFQILGEQKMSSGDFLLLAVEASSIESQIPSSSKRLKALQQTHRWQNGLHALVEIRNDLVHPTRKLGDVSDLAHREAWNLGQWFFEMLLLHQLEYQGSYRNRLATLHNEEEPFPLVPWA